MDLGVYCLPQPPRASQDLPERPEGSPIHENQLLLSKTNHFQFWKLKNNFCLAKQMISPLENQVLHSRTNDFQRKTNLC